MQLDISYRQIWKISAPIMLGSAAQNVIALSDAVLLYHRGQTEFAAIGFVGVFYITVAAIGYGFSRGGQIMIARRMGEGRPETVGHTFHAMLLFELALAVLLFGFMRFGSAWFFGFFLDSSPDVYAQALEYIEFRSWGIFFSYMGVALVSLYTGIARPGIVLFDTLVLAVVNLGLNYALIFGKWGFPEMGIAGSGLASSIAEAVAFAVFVVYMVFDGKNRSLRVFSVPKPDWKLARQQLNLALPVVAHSAIGQGSWIVFFGLIENLGERALAISNLARTVYLLLSIPLWGFAAGVNTLVSNLLGQNRPADVLPAALKTGWLCWLTTMALAVPVLFFPEKLLYPLLGKQDMSLVEAAKPIFKVLLGVLTVSTFGSVIVNALAGTGATAFGLRLQGIAVTVYLLFVYWVVNFSGLGLVWAWSGEVVYWVTMIGLALWFLVAGRWRRIEV